MRKRIIFGLVSFLIIVSTVGGFCYFKNNEKQNSLTPKDLVIISEPKRPVIFEKNKIEGSKIIKFLFKDFDGGCVYSIDEKIFLVTENSDKEDVICYMVCATEEKCKPIAVTTTGNYMIFENEQNEKIAVPMEQSQMWQLIDPKEPVPFDDLAKQEKISLFELIEE